MYGYVVMPEHAHLLVNEPERDTLARAMQSLKQGVARRLALRAEDSFWQARYYDFNVWSERAAGSHIRILTPGSTPKKAAPLAAVFGEWAPRIHSAWGQCWSNEAQKAEMRVRGIA